MANRPESIEKIINKKKEKQKQMSCEEWASYNQKNIEQIEKRKIAKQIETSWAYYNQANEEWSALNEEWSMLEAEQAAQIYFDEKEAWENYNKKKLDRLWKKMQICDEAQAESSAKEYFDAIIFSELDELIIKIRDIVKERMQQIKPNEVLNKSDILLDIINNELTEEEYNLLEQNIQNNIFLDMILCLPQNTDKCIRKHFADLMEGNFKKDKKSSTRVRK